MQDAWRAYLELAWGLTETTRRKAEQVTRDLVGRGGATAAQVQAFAEELMSTSRANREALAKLVRYEVDRALGAVGLASAEEVTDLTARLRRAEQRLDELAERAAAAETAAESAPAAAPAAGTGASSVPQPDTSRPAGEKTAAKAAKKQAATKSAAKKQAPKKSTTTETPA